VTRSKRPDQLSNQPKTWWQRSLAGERLPKGFFNAESKCDGTIEDYRGTALDVRKLTRQQVATCDWAWIPSADSRRENPRLPSFVPGGAPENPMGVAAMTLSGGNTPFTGPISQPWTAASVLMAASTASRLGNS
jgi:hypothetical protein